MRIVTVTGRSSQPTFEQTVTLDRLLEGADELHHGMCEGADEQAHWEAYGKDIPIVGHPGVDRQGVEKKRAAIDLKYFDDIRKAKWFLDRNEDMVDVCTEVIALVSHESTEFYRSGEWNTIKHALRVGKPVTLVLPSGISQEVVE